jgi:HD-like signal output (HDOD) protein
MADIAPFLQSVKLPVMPEVAHSLIRTLDDEDADVTTIRNIIAKDPALTATLLRMANSALFGLSRSVDSLDSAVSVVGLSQIRARALSICMTNVFSMPQGLNRLDFWRASLLCAGYARWLAGSIGMDEQRAWLAGMMLRLGELVIAQKHPGLLAAIEQQPCAPGERWARERTSCGFDEGQITAEIARRWDFPQALTDALQSCSQPLQGSEPSTLGAVVHLAALLADTPVVHAETLGTLPPLVVGLLRLDLERLCATLPDADLLGDTSTLKA